MNPILASEGRRRMRSWRTPILLTAFGGLMLLFCTISQLLPLTQETISLSSMRSGVNGYVIMLILQFGLIVLIAPTMSAGSIAGERERQTLDLLLVTNTGSLRIVLGKMLGSFAFLTLLIVGTLPITCSTLLFGSVDLIDICVSTLFMCVTAFSALSVGMFCSVIFKRTVTAVIMSYLALLAIGIFTLLPVAYINVFDARMIDAMNNGLLAESEFFRAVPPMLWLNPGLGLISLIGAQTGSMQNVISFYSITIGRIFTYIEQLQTIQFHIINMGSMFILSMVLIFTSALFVRPRRRRHKRARKGA